MTEQPTRGAGEAPRFIHANGLRFGYLESGSGPLVLLLHGFPDDAYTFEVLLPVFAAGGFHAVAPFLRGYHPTDVPPDGDYATLTLGRDVLALIDAFGAGAGAVVGHDWGAVAAYAAASLAPEKVSQLAVIGMPHLRALRPTPAQLWRARHFALFALPGAAKRARRRRLVFVDRLFRRWSPKWRPPADQLRHIKESLALPGRLEATLDYYRDVPRSLLDRKTRQALLRPIQVPTLAISGTADRAVKTATMARAAKHFTAGYQLRTVPDAGHFVHLEHPAEVASHLLAFLQSAPSPPHP